MITHEYVQFRSGEKLHISRADDTVVGVTIIPCASGENDYDALMTLAGRMKTLAVELENLALSRK